MTSKTVPVHSDHRPAEGVVAPPVVTADFTSKVFHASSASHPTIRPTLAVTTTPAGTVRVSCTCPAGRFARPDLNHVPCRHAKAVCALLTEHDLVTSDGSGWRVVAQEGPVAA